MSTDTRRPGPGDPPALVRWLLLMLLAMVLAVVLMPWVWALVSSFKARGDIMSTGFKGA